MYEKGVCDKFAMSETRLKESNSEKKRPPPLSLLTLSLALVVLALSIFCLNLAGRLKSANELAEIGGSKLVTSSELIKLVADRKLTVYWAGNLPNSQYQLNALNLDQITLSYFPTAQTLVGTKPNLSIGTYLSKNSSVAVQLAMRSTGNIGVRTPDGANAYFSRTNPNDLFVALPKIDAEIEIYATKPGGALALLTKPGLIRRIGSKND